MKHTFFLGTVIFHLAASAGQSAPANVIEYAERIDREMTDDLHTVGRTLRRHSFHDVIRIVRDSPSAARSWRLEPALVPSLTDGEIVDFVANSANHYFICSAYVFSTISLESIDQGYDSSPLFGLPALSVPMSCGDVIGIGNDPIEQPIDTKERFDYALAKLRMHAPREGQTLLASNYQNPAYQGNKRYMQRNHDQGQVHPSRSLDNIEGLEEAEVFSYDMMSLILFIKIDGQRPRLIYAVPFNT